MATDYLRQQRPICSRRVDGFQATVPARRRRDRAQGFARRFIAVAMDLAMVSPAQRDLVAERPILGKTQVMGVTGPSSADQAGLL